MDEKAVLEEEAGRFFSGFDDDIPAPRPDLYRQTVARVHSEVTARDIFELFSSVFVMGCCVPLLGLFFGGLCVIEENSDD